MTQLIADKKDIDFILYNMFNTADLTDHDEYRDFSKKTFDMVISEARALAIKEILPTLTEGDENGVRFENGKVFAPPSYHKAWQAIVDAEMVSTMEDPEWGGQGMPYLISVAVMDYIIGANYSLSGYTHMGHGTGKMIELFGTDELKQLFLKKLYTARWGGTMLLTEPEAGSDVGALTTSARKNDDGTYTITGNKIFITAGDHDLTENIIHPVLARVEGAPEGSRGISIFIVPKIWVNPDGSLGEFNNIKCTGIEKKMGMHGSSTCAMSLGDQGQCRGFLLGEENQGLPIMFHMMNEARINVGFQGSAAASMAYLYALDYARARNQGKDILEFKNPEAKSIPIIRHPDVRRMLVWMKAHVDGMRSLIYYVCSLFDEKKVTRDASRQKRAAGLIDLLTPVIKAYCAERGFDVCVQAVQVFGGYGYTREFPVEQLVRDTKIASIYEGTNGIQAMDLLGRKLGMENGQVFMSLLEAMNHTIDKAGKYKRLSPMADRLNTSVQALGATALTIGEKAMTENCKTVFAHAHPFLEATGDVCMGWMHLWRALAATQSLESVKKKKDRVFYEGIVSVSSFFMETVLPVAFGRMKSVQGLSNAALSIEDTALG